MVYVAYVFGLGCSACSSSDVPENLHACVPNAQIYQACTVLEDQAKTTLRTVGLDSTDIAYVATGYRQVLFGRPLFNLAQGDADPYGLSFVFARLAYVRDAVRPDGTYAVSQSTGALTVRTYAPQDGDALERDILALESYFEGVHLSASATLEQSSRALDQPVSFTLSWEGRGALADWIDPEQNLTSPLTFDASFEDLGRSGRIAGLEPFDAILDFEADWVEDGEKTETNESESAGSGSSDTHLTWHCGGQRLSLRKHIKPATDSIACEVSGSRERVKLQSNLKLKSNNGLLSGSVAYELKLPGSTKVEIKDTYTISKHDNPSFGSEPVRAAWSCHK